jgi:hypothetical protein
VSSTGAILTDADGTVEWQAATDTANDSLITPDDVGPQPTESDTMISVSTAETIQARPPLGEAPQRGLEQGSLSLVNGTTPLEEGQSLVYMREGETVQPDLVTEAVALAPSPNQPTDLRLRSVITTQDPELHNPSGGSDSGSEVMFTPSESNNSSDPGGISQEMGCENHSADSVSEQKPDVSQANERAGSMLAGHCHLRPSSGVSEIVGRPPGSSSRSRDSSPHIVVE